MMSLNFPLFVFLFGLLSFSFKCKHFLLMLLSLEFVVLGIFLMMFFVCFAFNMDYYFSMIFIAMVVCESSLGLSLLVIMVRSYGNDYFQSLNVLW